MKIIGHQATSLIDYPDKICTLYFVAGCNFKCPYCHNAPIVKHQGQIIEEQEIFSFLKKRKKFIDGVCISGGEPTLYQDLPQLIHKIKEEGLLVKLDTNGTNPKMLEKLIEEKMVDYIAMDIKAPLCKYKAVTKTEVDLEAIQASIALVRKGLIDYEFRTTVCKELLTLEDVLQIAQEIKESKRYYLQQFRDGEHVLEGPKQLSAYDIKTMQDLCEKIKHNFHICKVR